MVRGWICALAFLSPACGGSPSRATDAGPSVTDAAADLIGYSPMCTDPRADIYKANLAKPSAMSLYMVTLVSSDPGPPIIGTNTWSVVVGDASGSALTGATLTLPTKVDNHPNPWMPDHGHGTILVQVTAGAGAGAYTITPLYYYMAGLWQVTFDVQGPGSAASDSVSFSFCLADF